MALSTLTPFSLDCHQEACDLLSLTKLQMILNQIPPPTSVHQAQKNKWSVFHRDYFASIPRLFLLPWERLVTVHLQADLKKRKEKAKQNMMQPERAMGYCLLQVASSKAGRTYLDSLQHCDDLGGKIPCIKDLALRADMCLTVTTCTFFLFMVHTAAGFH